MPPDNALYTEDDLLPISALQHMAFCARRCALVHLEGLWADNRFTAEGNLLHKRVHEQGDSTAAGLRVARGLRLASFRLGLFGVADVVEFHAVSATPDSGRLPDGDEQPDSPPPDVPFPVEYKRGKRKPEQAHRVQLCAQAMCIEEMLGVGVPCGALYFGKSRRRMAIAFDAPLRGKTEDLANAVHAMLRSGRTPSPERGPKCKGCSLCDLCMPRGVGRRSAVKYVSQAISLTLAESTDETP